MVQCKGDEGDVQGAGAEPGHGQGHPSTAIEPFSTT
jgi:hypothetical protein